VQNYVQNVVELRRAVDILAARDDVDGSRLGFIGHSYGAQIGGVLSGVEKRIKAFVLMTGGAYQSRFARTQCSWLKPRALAAYVRAISLVDPAYYVPHAAPSALFVQSALRDQYIPRRDALALQRLASSPKTIKWYRASHDLNEAARRDRDDWIVARLRAAPARAPRSTNEKENCLRKSDHCRVR
jgi:dienelactone hydrolase